MTNARQPRVFVGTMYSGEAEFKECCAMIAAQEAVDVTHKVISDLPEAAAHAALWNAWNEVKDGHDIFAKVDADTILKDHAALRRVWELFAADQRITGVQILLHDYFTERLIAGLNFFSRAVIFEKPRSSLMCDRVDTGHDKVLKGDAVAHLAPIGYHCKYPSPMQSFHFGLRRALKRQTDVIAQVAEAWQRNRDEGRGWALAGAMMSTSFRLGRHYDYGDSRFRDAFETLQRDPRRLDRVDDYAEKVLGRAERRKGSR